MGNGKVEVLVFGKAIIFEEDLKKYVKITSGIAEQTIQILKHFEEAYNNNRDLYVSTNDSLKAPMAQVSHEMCDYLLSALFRDDDKIDILEMCERKCELVKPFDEIMSSYFEGIEKIHKAWEKEYNDIIMGLSDEADERVRQSEREAMSEVRGLGFGILSGSIMAHALYAAQSALNLKKQERILDKTINAATEKSKEKFNNDLDYYLGQARVRYSDRHKVCITETMKKYEMQFLKILKEHGLLSETCTFGINETKSEEIINYISTGANREANIIRALILCPYNIQAYKVASEIGMNDQGLSTLISYFELDEYVK